MISVYVLLMLNYEPDCASLCVLLPYCVFYILTTSGISVFSYLFVYFYSFSCLILFWHVLIFSSTTKGPQVYTVAILNSSLNIVFFHLSACCVLVLKSVGCVYVTPVLPRPYIYILLFFTGSCYRLLLQQPNFLSGVVKVSCCLILQGQLDLTYSAGRAVLHHSAYSIYTCMHPTWCRLCAVKQHDLGCSCGY